MSWYPATKLDKKTIRYLKAIQEVFYVKDTSKKWVPYKLQPHQIAWHAEDICIKGSKAKSRIVTKSRNTSFTTSAIISNLTSIYPYNDNLVPFVRLNQQRAIDIIKEEKQIIKHMKPLQLSDGAYWPFNNKDVNMDNSLSIKFPNNVEHRGFPANNASADSIRGERISGSAGILDETNFMKNWNELFTSLRDASSGGDFQMNLGTTLRGQSTPFKLWFDKQRELQENKLLNEFIIYNWPVVDLGIYQPGTSLLNYPNLEPIVPWHKIEKLESKRLQDEHTFMEEYLGLAVDAENQFFPTELIMKTVNQELENYLEKLPDPSRFAMSIDVATSHDYFVINIVDYSTGDLIQKYLYYANHVELPMMEKKVKNIIDRWLTIGLDRVFIDSVGIGMHLYQLLKEKYKKIITPYTNSGNVYITKSDKKTMNEYTVTTLKKLMYDGKIQTLQDELQIRHFQNIDYTYKATSNSDGHSDCVSTWKPFVLLLNGNISTRKLYLSTKIHSNLDKAEPSAPETAEEIQKKFYAMPWKKRKKYYTKIE